jgi:hypothetical protein
MLASSTRAMESSERVRESAWRIGAGVGERLEDPRRAGTKQSAIDGRQPLVKLWPRQEDRHCLGFSSFPCVARSSEREPWRS